MKIERCGLFIVSFLISPAYAGIGGGERAIAEPAACRIEKFDRADCSGTLVTTDAGTALLTAGHCLHPLRVPLAYVKVLCGCTAARCLETFSIAGPSALHIRSRMDGGFTAQDSALAMLDHAASAIQPLKMGFYGEYFAWKTGARRPGVECIKGGYGMDGSGQMSSTPRFFPVRATSAPVAVNTDVDTDSFVRETLGFAPAAQFAPIQFAYQVLPFSRTWIARGWISHILLVGDSGSGLLCRRGDRPFEVVAIAESVLPLPETAAHTRPIVVRYSLLPQSLLVGI